MEGSYQSSKVDLRKDFQNHGGKSLLQDQIPSLNFDHCKQDRGRGRELVYFECLLGMNVWICSGGGV